MTLKSSTDPKEINIGLSEMNFSKVGNSKKAQLYKDVFKNLLRVNACKVIHNKSPKDLFSYLLKKL